MTFSETFIPRLLRYGWEVVMRISEKVRADSEEFQRDQNLRIATQLQQDFERLAADLESEVRAEEERTRVSDPTHVAYSMFAKAVRARRENLLRSRDELLLYLNAVHAPMEEHSEEPYAA
jgi:flagellar FliJ protein